MFDFHYVKRKSGGASIGPDVCFALRELDRRGDKIIAIVPTMLSFYGTAPERHEVTEVQIFTIRGDVDS